MRFTFGTFRILCQSCAGSLGGARPALARRGATPTGRLPAAARSGGTAQRRALAAPCAIGCLCLIKSSHWPSERGTALNAPASAQRAQAIPHAASARLWWRRGRALFDMDRNQTDPQMQHGYGTRETRLAHTRGQRTGAPGVCRASAGSPVDRACRFSLAALQRPLSPLGDFIVYLNSIVTVYLLLRLRQTRSNPRAASKTEGRYVSIRIPAAD